MRAGPPPDVPPDRLWRSLLPLRPEHRLSWRFPSDPDLPLTVRAVPALVFALAQDDAAEPGIPAKVAIARECRAIVAATLWIPQQGRLAFDSAEQVGEVYQNAFDTLAGEVLDGLDRICPTFWGGRTDVKAWQKALLLGASHPANGAFVVFMAECKNMVAGATKMLWDERKDRYWNLPASELLDGHHLAWAAAMKAKEKSAPPPPKPPERPHPPQRKR